MFELLVHLCIYWAGCKTPFIDVTFPQTVDATLTDVCCRGRTQKKEAQLPNCVLCARIGRSVRTPDVEVSGFNLRKEITRFSTLFQYQIEMILITFCRQRMQGNTLRLTTYQQMICDRLSQLKNMQAQRKKICNAGKKQIKNVHLMQVMLEQRQNVARAEQPVAFSRRKLWEAAVEVSPLRKIYRAWINQQS